MHGHNAGNQHNGPAQATSHLSLLQQLRQQLRNRPDTEHEMTPNRMVFAGSVIGYLLVATWLGNEEAHAMLLGTYQAFIVYFTVALAIFAHIVWKPGVSFGRRLIAMVSDFSMISFAAAVGGISTGFFYPFFLWTIFGNGFRFGIRSLHAAMLVGNIGFLAVIAATGVWRDHLGMSIALSLTLLMLPLYAGKLIKKISEAREQAEQANRAKGAFLASISHELRTPLNAVIGLGDILRTQIRDPEQRHMVRTIVDAGRTLLNLINSILDFSRIESGKMPSNVVDVDFYGELRRIETMLAVQADSKSIAFNLQVSARTPRHIRVDFGHVEQVLVNLSANAVKFTANGHVVISVDAVRQEEDQVRLRFEVADTGIGIAPEAQTRIFEAFSQADATILDRFGGTGLGLAISNQLVQLMNGQIGLTSESGKGSTFWFEVDAKLLPSVAEDVLPDLQFLTLLTQDPVLSEAVQRLDYDLTETSSVDQLLCTLEGAPNGETSPIVILDRLNRSQEAMSETVQTLRRARAQVIVVEPEAGEAADIATKRDCVTSVARPLQRKELQNAIHLAALKARSEADDADISPPPTPDHRALSILVAEDNLTNQMVIAKILERAGHRSTLVNNGQEALDALRDGTFDLVLMDINMPVLNGLEATKLHRFASIDQVQIPIVALTADATADALARCEEAGVNAYATKPIEPKVLLEIINRVTSGTIATADEPASTVPTEFTFSQDVAGAVIDTSKLDYLEDLGGREFLSNIVSQFSLDSRQLLSRLGDSAAKDDVREFREALHALRSSAANVGATRVFESCLSLRSITEQKLAIDGENCVRGLEEEVRLALTNLEHHSVRPDTSESESLRLQAS